MLSSKRTDKGDLAGESKATTHLSGSEYFLNTARSLPTRWPEVEEAISLHIWKLWAEQWHQEAVALFSEEASETGNDRWCFFTINDVDGEVKSLRGQIKLEMNVYKPVYNDRSRLLIYLRLCFHIHLRLALILQHRTKQQTSKKHSQNFFKKYINFIKQPQTGLVRRIIQNSPNLKIPN